MGFVVNDTVLGETLAEVSAMVRSWQIWIGLCATAVIMGLIGPFGTYTTMSVPLRLMYWAVVVVSTYWIGYVVSFAMATWVEALGGAPPWSVGLGAAVAAVPVSLWLSVLHAVLLADPFLAEFIRLFPYVVVISLVVTFLFEAIESWDGSVAKSAAAPSEPVWLDRLPPELGRDLLLLQAQDHYLRAATSLGETLLRGSIGEAEEELGDYGIRVHRSWWVSRSAIQTYRSRQGARIVILSTGEEVPVGRSYRRRVRDFIDGIGAG